VIDTATRALYDRAVRDAVAHGRDVGEELDRLGLLLTAQRRRLLIHTTLRNVAVGLERAGGPWLMRVKFGRDSGTPADMLEAVLDWLEKYMKGRNSEPG
jgi:hypothetical protein